MVTAFPDLSSLKLPALAAAVVGVGVGISLGQGMGGSLVLGMAMAAWVVSAVVLLVSWSSGPLKTGALVVLVAGLAASLTTTGLGAGGSLATAAGITVVFLILDRVRCWIVGSLRRG